MRFAPTGGNVIHISEQELKPLMDELEIPVPETEEKAPEVSPEIMAEINIQKARKRNENVKKLFDGLKGKFMKLFEDVEDQEIN